MLWQFGKKCAGRKKTSCVGLLEGLNIVGFVLLRYFCSKLEYVM